MVQHRAVQMDVVQNEQPHVISFRFLWQRKSSRLKIQNVRID